MESHRYSSLIVCSLLAILGFQSVDSVANHCTQEDQTGHTSLSAQCTRNAITVNIIGDDFDYSRALYYVCDSANISGTLPVFVEDIRRIVIGEVHLPHDTACTVFGCYIEYFGCHRLFINGSCTTDTNECEFEPRVCHEHATCTNTDGSYICACNPGFTGNGTNCEDVNECSSDALNNCREFENSICDNTIGSFDCICSSGYNISDGKNCTDIDECEVELCDEQANCTNTDGSYTCTCNSGFTGNGTNCEDVNECSSDALNNCYEFENTICNNTIGSFDCNCSPGYYTSDGGSCTDIDECEAEPEPCHEQANCTNTDGSYTCTCNPGFTGDGTNCEDVNECSSEALNNCLEFENTICNNTIGSFDCICSSGYNTSDGDNCTDVDECEIQSLNTCHEYANCSNTNGSYECSCQPGFQGNGVDCTDVDECSQNGENDCHTFANTVCHNTNGSYECICKPGYSRNEVNCSEISNDTSSSGEEHRHMALGVGLTLPLVLVVAGGALTLVLVLWRCRRGRRSFRHYKFNVHSEVDLNYNPQGIQLDAFFSFQGSLGSILHELKYDNDTPIMTDAGSGESDFEKHPGKSTKVKDVKEEEANSGAQNIHEAAPHGMRDDDNSSISTRVGDELLHLGISDCNSSTGMTSSLTRMHEIQSNPSSTGGYVSEQSGGLVSPGYRAWNGWQSGGNQVPLNTKGARTDYLTENAISASQVRVGAPVGGSPSETTAGSTQSTAKMEDRVPHIEAHGDTKHHVSSAVPAGYVSSDQHTFPSSGQSSTGTATVNDPIGKKTHPLPTHALALQQPPTATTTTIQSKDTREPPPTTRASSLVSLNIITDLDQAFPRFVSEDSLYRHYAPATALPQPPWHPNTSRARSEIHLNYIPAVCTQIYNHRENSTLVSSHSGISSRPNLDTPCISGGRCPILEHLAPDPIADTSTEDFPGISTIKATEHSNTHIVSSNSTQHTWSRTSTALVPPELSAPNYVNLDSTALIFTGEGENSRSVSFEVPQEVDSAVASEECGHPLHSTASPSSPWPVMQQVTGLEKASYQQQSLPDSASDESEGEESMPSQHADNSSVTSSPSHSYKNSSVSGFHNVSFDLPETLVESEIEDPY